MLAWLARFPCSLSVWYVHVLPMYVFAGYSGVLSQSRNMRVGVD